MKLIDEKGKIFGKINVIDFLVILFLLCLMPMFYFGYKIFNKKATSLLKEPSKIAFDFYGVVNDLPEETIKLISVGDKHNEYGKTIGEILAMSKPEDNVYDVKIGENKFISLRDTNRKQIFIKVRLSGEVIDDAFYYRNERINIGSKIPFNSEKYKIEIKIESASKEIFESKGIVKSGPKPMYALQLLEPMELSISFKPLEPDRVILISVGDIFIDEAGKQLGEILNIGESVTYSHAVDLGGGNTIYRQDPTRRELLIKAKLLGEIKDSAFYYRGKKINTGSKIQFTTDKYTVEGIVKSGPKPMYAPQLLEPMELSISFKPLEPDRVILISVGDIFIDEAGKQLGKILNIGEPVTYSYAVDLGGGNTIYRQDPTRRELLIKAKLLGEIKDSALYYRGKKINTGSKIQFTTDKYVVEGIVKSEPKPMLQQIVLLEVKFKNLIPEVANFIKINHGEKDEGGNIIAKIKSIISNNPSEIFVQENGKIISAHHPVNRDVVLTIEAMCMEDGDRLFFKKNVIKIGNDVLLTTDKYDISGTIIGIN